MSAPVLVAFLGPSLPADEARRLAPEARLEGPARRGDVLRVLRDRPKVIALVDGVFESQPSVWHQELRLALASGAHVVGASSMGALRAVELEAFGMRGVGRVYRAYREGRCVDDADVALLHASAEHGFRPLTLPLVNVVAAAERAVEAQAITAAEGRALVRAARGVHYKDRRWPDVLARVRWSAARKAAFEAFRRAHPVDVKADDARACLVEARRLLALPPPPPAAVADLSVWARADWLAAQPPASGADAARGLQTLLLAEWARSLGLVPDPARVEALLHARPRDPLDPGLQRRFAEAVALEELLVAHPELASGVAPLPDEGAILDAWRTRPARRSR